jgi:hypothetical protein
MPTKNTKNGNVKPSRLAVAPLIENWISPDSAREPDGGPPLEGPTVSENLCARLRGPATFRVCVCTAKIGRCAHDILRRDHVLLIKRAELRVFSIRSRRSTGR